MMKKLNKPVFYLALVMIFPLLFGYMCSVWFIKPVVNKSLTGAQIEEICRKLKFELAPGETIYTGYFPGAMQAPRYLRVHIGNISSEADFLSRLQVDSVRKSGVYYASSKTISEYIPELFYPRQLYYNEKPKDYRCRLTFYESGGNISAEYYISGYVAELKYIYDFSYIFAQAFLSNWMFMIPLATELILIAFLVIQIPIRFLRIRKETHCGY